MKHCRVDLWKTNYKLLDNTLELHYNMKKPRPILGQCVRIYKEYCDYKKFESCIPIFIEEFEDERNDVICYYDKGEIVAWSLIYHKKFGHLEATQFAWDYKNPKLRLGIKSLYHECAYYKKLGQRYYYLGDAYYKYKKEIQGFEILGKL